jgi:hypothetical protein
MDAQRGSRYRDLLFNFDSRWSGWSTTRSGCFTPEKVPVRIVEEAGWSSRSVWMGVENFATHWDSIPGPPSP